MSKRFRPAIAVFVFKQLDLIFLCLLAINARCTICKDYITICLSILYKTSLDIGFYLRPQTYWTPLVHCWFLDLGVWSSGWHSYTFTTWIAVDTTRNCRLQSWTLHKSADCRWISITILYVSFTNSATVRRREQVQLCNRLIDQSADNITGLKCAKECLILKYKYIQNPWFDDACHR